VMKREGILIFAAFIPPVCNMDGNLHFYEMTINIFDSFFSYPVGHPKVYKGDDYNCPPLKRVFGLIKCRVRAPPKLFHPVLPCNSLKSGKLMFFLCPVCAEEKNQNSCTHSDTEREFTGTWVSIEVQLALEMGYTVVKVMHFL
jgi:hypothetical protein